MKFLPALLLFTILAIGCDKNESPPSGIEIGQTFSVGEATLLFAAIEEDSRCPCEADCIWEGVATVRLLSGTDTVRVHTTNSGDYSTTAAFAGQTIRLIELLPFPCGGQPDSQDDYRITLMVE